MPSKPVVVVPQNKLLSALPPEDYARILPSLSSVPLRFSEVLHKAGSKIDTIYFPDAGVGSVCNAMADGRAVEVATIGNEGMVGMTVFLGGEIAPAEVFMQVPGHGMAMSSEAFRDEVEQRGALYDVISRYSQALQVFLMQSVACNALHSVEERCARWLLMTDDRVEGPHLPLTHQFLSVMLGVRRPTVSLVLGTLHKAGLIDGGTKKITIVDRKGLEAATCECYQVVKSTFDRLLPYRRRDLHANN